MTDNTRDVICNIHRIKIEPKYECHLCRENREYQEDKKERDRILGGDDNTRDEVLRDCNCQGWKDNLPKINSPIELQAIRSGGKGYTGIPFQYCPWCGKSRKPSPEDGMVTLDRKLFEEETKKFFRWNRGGQIHSVTLESDAQKYFDYICSKFVQPKQEEDRLVRLDEDELYDFLFQKGITVSKFMSNELDMLVKEICSKFGQPKREKLSLSDIKKALVPIPSNGVPISQNSINGKVYYYMCKDDIAEIIHHLLNKKE